MRQPWLSLASLARSRTQCNCGAIPKQIPTAPAIAPFQLLHPAVNGKRTLIALVTQAIQARSTRAFKTQCLADNRHGALPVPVRERRDVEAPNGLPLPGQQVQTHLAGSQTANRTPRCDTQTYVDEHNSLRAANPTDGELYPSSALAPIRQPRRQVVRET